MTGNVVIYEVDAIMCVMLSEAENWLLPQNA